MFNTLKSKIGLIVTSIVALTVAVVLIFVQNVVEKEMLNTLEHNALNLMNTIKLNIENEYKSVLFYEKSVLDMRKHELKNVVALAYRVIEEEYDLYKSGIVAEAEAKQMVVKRIKQMRYDDGVGYFWINDMGEPYPKMVMHPTIPELDGQILDDESFNCALGIRKNLFLAFNDVCRDVGYGYVDYLWPKPTVEGLTVEQPKISFVRLFDAWNWVIGSGLYIDDVEEEVQKRKDAIVDELTQTMKSISVGKTGYIYIFNGRSDMLVHPTLSGRNASALRNPVTGNFIIEELVETSKRTNKLFRYRWDKPGDEGNYVYWKRAYVEYFEPLDWYIGSSVYEDEVVAPVVELSEKILIVGVVSLFIALVVAIVLSSKLVSPLSRLMKAAELIDKEGLNSTDIPIDGTKETKALGRVLHTMMGSIRENLQELSKTKSYLDNVINSMPSVLIGIDSDCNITKINDHAQKYIDSSIEDPIGKELNEIFPQCKDYIIELKKAVSQRKIIEKEQVIFETKNENRIVNITTYPLITNGVIGAVVRIDDVTEKVRLEEMMIQTEKMMSVGGLAAGMAHEINNPLGAILQGAQNIIRRLDPSLAKNQEIASQCGIELNDLRTYLDKREILMFLNGIRDSGDRAAKIVSNMLQFSRQSAPAPVVADLAEIIEKTLELAANDYDLKKKYDFRHIEIVREYDDNIKDIPCIVTEIEQVLLNLFKNAAYAINDINQAEPKITIRLKQEDKFVCIEVEDNGIGMEEAIRKRVFEPFFTTKPVGIGTGLGLSVSFFIVTENHCGAMGVESQPGKGTVFTVKLPC